MLGGVSRITVENATLEVERINNAIDDRLRKRGISVDEFRMKFFQFGLKCIEVLDAHKRKFVFVHERYPIVNDLETINTMLMCNGSLM